MLRQLFIACLLSVGHSLPIVISRYSSSRRREPYIDRGMRDVDTSFVRDVSKESELFKACYGAFIITGIVLSLVLIFIGVTGAVIKKIYSIAAKFIIKCKN